MVSSKCTPSRSKSKSSSSSLTKEPDLAVDITTGSDGAAEVEGGPALVLSLNQKIKSAIPSKYVIKAFPKKLAKFENLALLQS